MIKIKIIKELNLIQVQNTIINNPISAKNLTNDVNLTQNNAYNGLVKNNKSQEEFLQENRKFFLIKIQ